MFEKSLKMPFWPFFFTILTAAQKFRPKQGLLIALGELGKSIWRVDLKKAHNIFEILLKPNSQSSPSKLV